MDEHVERYCPKCGRALIVEFEPDGFHIETGRPVGKQIKKCPKYDNWWDGSQHFRRVTHLEA